MQASSVDVGYKANNHLLFLGQWIQSNIASVILEVSISPRLRLGLIDTSRITSAMLDCILYLIHRFLFSYWSKLYNVTHRISIYHPDPCFRGFWLSII